MRTPRHRRAQARRPRQERVEPYSAETEEAIAALVGGLAAMPPTVVLIFHGLLNGLPLDEIAAALHTTPNEARAIIARASREHPMLADAYRATKHAPDAKA